MQTGDRVFISWRPNRWYTFRFLGGNHSIVNQAENSKLKVGNAFYCGLFILDEPLYLTDLMQGNNPLVAFVLGNRNGLCEIQKR